MAALLRSIVAGPRLRHPEAGLDLCYVTDNIIATSGPSSTYPQRAYRNPVDELVNFLDSKHGIHWAIWEFRAEGTGYPDSEVYHRIRHYPWPDHHPPPFALIPNIMASMRNWLKDPAAIEAGRVVVVHCKAGKGRTGTVVCSYLISEESWSKEDALVRFTEKRMRTGFGAGISIPSQARWVDYVERWATHGKLYVERNIEILEVHVWGLRAGVKVEVEGYVDEGKTIKTFHIFKKEERIVVNGTAENGGIFANLMGLSKDLKNYNASTTSTSMPTTEGVGSDMVAGEVIFRPFAPLILPSNDINIDFERRNKATYGWTLVTSVAHAWFNTFFEGRGPENGGVADESGVFEIGWDAMDGVKGSKHKGAQALDRVAIVWRAVNGGDKGLTKVITQPGTGEQVPDMQPADWRAGESQVLGEAKDLGLRPSESRSTESSEASSVKETAEDTSAIVENAALAQTRHHGLKGEEYTSRPGL